VSDDSLTKLSDPVPVVVRSTNLPSAKDYHDYREVLRYDFLHCCAYCTMSESEGGAIRFTIDHYEPRSAHPELANVYENLFWACDECNGRKGDLVPPPAARQAGLRFFRIDRDIADDHFELDGLRLKHRSTIGDFTIEFVDLNRQGLRRLRDIRRRLDECERFVREGIYALKESQIDRLPLDDRRRVFTAIMRAARMGEQLADEIDVLLRKSAKSDLIDPDPESADRANARRQRMAEHQATFAGKWRGRNFD
jgi:hypothetical protein